MTTILILNAVSLSLAGAGIGAWVTRQTRRARAMSVVPVYVMAEPAAPRSSRSLR